ncbi:hypothetical protein BJ875DRAFT_390230 [Amylocarpus encephaloides]|uniref:N-acetyltransferase domain-containing protein n=1 Tax=Amylocarpus encephaloides TaxID=45428 RepID=A0A9P8BZD5_9HELO|nr:hypothetical protein BJ875DRAFT_390230 [Amylocarpus encephaloides]
MSLTTAGTRSIAANSTNSAPVTNGIAPRAKVVIRLGRLWDAQRIGVIASATYLETPMTKYLSPRAKNYYFIYELGFKLRALNRMLDAQNATFVAVEETNQNYAIGYAQFVRLGNDEGAKKQIASRGWWGLTLVAFVFGKILLPIFTYCFASWSDDLQHVNEFVRALFKQSASVFDSHPKRRNRWHAQSVVVSVDFQRMKIGKTLMGEAIKRAREEGVIVGLEASAEGEMMYKSVGFEVVQRFEKLKGMPDEVPKEGGGIGGVMIWKPEGFTEDEKE